MERAGFEQWKPREVARLLALVETERRYYQEIVATLPAALVVLSAERIIVSANRAFRAIVHLRAEDLRQKTIEQVLPSDELIEAIRTAHVHGETRPVRLNMGERAFRAAAIPIRSWEDDMEPETLLMVEDLSGLEAAPAPSGLNAAPGIIWEADPRTLKFTAVNGSAEAILGYAPAHWLSTPEFISERIHPGDRDNVMMLYHALAAMGGEASAEFRVMSASGQAVWCRETMRVTEVPGRGLIATGVLTAIGQRRWMEEQSMTAGRTEALRNLAARLAHDLNNPLMIVTGYGEEMLHALREGDAMRGDVSEILAAATRMSELTSQLLAFARPALKAGSRIGFQDAVTGLRERLAAESGAAVNLESEPSSADVWIMADRERLSVAVAALASAAREQSAGAAELRMVYRTALVAEQVQGATLSPGSYACIEVRASGAEAAEAPGIFENFLPGKDPSHASGPALAQAYAAIRQWGGDISSASGAFTVYLPCVEPEERAEAPAPAATEPEAPTQPEPVSGPPRPTVLLVEDEPGIRGLVRKILHRENYVVIEAGSAEEAAALETSSGAHIDLLLTDVMLPGMSGRDLAGQLREKHPELKVVYISGYTDDAAVQAGEFPPGAKFLQKPFTLGALTSTVRDALGS